MDKSDLLPSLRENTVEQCIEIVKTAYPIVSPVAGSIISFLLGALPKTRERRISRFVENIFEKLQQDELIIEKIEQRISSNQEQLEHIVEKVVSTAKPDKIEIFASIFINELKGFDLNEETKEYILNIIDSRLTTLHIRILSLMNNPKDYIELNNIGTGINSATFSQVFSFAFPEVNIEVIKSAYIDLFDQGFIKTGMNMFVTMTSNRGIRLLENSVTEFGKILINYCMIKKDA